MGNTILPSGENIQAAPDNILRYVNPDGLRQIMRQERLRWNLKPNKDADYYDNQHLFKYASELHNEGLYQRMEIRTYPDNGAYDGYAGINIDSGLSGIPHDFLKWDRSISDESLNKVINRIAIGAIANIPGKKGYGLNDDQEMVTDTEKRVSAIVFDPGDGRAYLLSNDDPTYVNNETRSIEERLPDRALARIGDIPTRITQLKNDLDFVSDPDYRHTDNNFTTSNRYVLDNLDDRTFVYPEVSRDTSGDYIENYRVGLNGEPNYGESDGSQQFNTQPDLGHNPDLGDYGDRFGESVSSYGHNQKNNGINHKPGYLPAIFRSVEELERVDLIDQRMDPLDQKHSPGSRRPSNYYLFDGVWNPNWFDREGFNDSYLSPALNPNNMEVQLDDSQPVPFSDLPQMNDPIFDRSQLYQWRYNRVTIKYYSKDVQIRIEESGEQYKVGDILRWSFGDDIFRYKVTVVGPNGQIQSGVYLPEENRVYEQNPSTFHVGLPFTNMTGVGHGAKLSVLCRARIENHAGQIKSNLYAYVDVTPSVRSDNSSEWSDVNMPDSQDGRVNVRSTAAGPAYSGINSGRGGPIPNPNTSNVSFYEHGGNATAGVHVHLFRYIIDTRSPKWVERNGIKIYTGRWVDQGPMGIERPCDIKALLFSNPDTNNFNNYYKFMIDSFFDSMYRNPDGTASNNQNATSHAYIHVDDHDPTPDRRFTEMRVDPHTTKLIEVDITEKVFYVNGATGVMFIFNSSYKNDPSYGYGTRSPGWIPIAGATTR